MCNVGVILPSHWGSKEYYFFTLGNLFICVLLYKYKYKYLFLCMCLVLDVQSNSAVQNSASVYNCVCGIGMGIENIVIVCLWAYQFLLWMPACFSDSCALQNNDVKPMRLHWWKLATRSNHGGKTETGNCDLVIALINADSTNFGIFPQFVRIKKSLQDIAILQSQ